VYTLLGEEPPAELARPISQGHRHPRVYSEPTGLLRVKINGRRSYFEWINAGRCTCQGGRGTMNMGAAGIISELYFGADTERLLVRLDAHAGPIREQLAEVDALRFRFLHPEGFELVVERPGTKEPSSKLLHAGVPVAEAGVEAAGDLLFEMGVPFRSLAVTTDDPVHFYVELLRDDQSIERIPHEGAIETTVPSPDYELIMWQA
jgi:hypothetical protein